MKLRVNRPTGGFRARRFTARIMEREVLETRHKAVDKLEVYMARNFEGEDEIHGELCGKRLGLRIHAQASSTS